MAATGRGDPRGDTRRRARLARCPGRPYLLAVVAVVLVVSTCRAGEGTAGVSRQVPVHAGQLEVEAGATWATSITTPRFSDGEVPVLRLRARLHTPLPGGCNYVLQVRLDGLPLTESPLHPRLLNKAPWFDPPGTAYHFSWYGAAQQGWMTIFSPDFAGDWGGTGRDYEFLFDLSGLVVGGRSLPLSFTYLNPDIPAALGVDRAPLTMDRVAIEALPRVAVDELRQEAMKGEVVSVVPADPDLPADVTPGERPYEIVWSGRRESPHAQVGFEDLTGWTMAVLGDAPVRLAASVRHVLWRPRLAAFSYGGGTVDTVVEIRPPEPIPIQGRFDAANLWLYGAWDRAGDTPLRVSAMLEDRAGRELEIDLGAVTASYWGMQHGVLDPRAAALARFPVSFTALRLTNCKAKGERHAYLESLAFYRQKRKPLAAPARSRAAVFPTSDDGMLPTPPPGTVTRVTPRGQGAEFAAEVRGNRLRYQVSPEDGCLHGVTARWNDGPQFRPMSAGGIRLATDGTGPVPPTSAAVVVSSALRGGRLTVRWRLERAPRPVDWEADYSLRGCSLVVDVRCSEGEATGLALGLTAGLPEPRGIEVPYLLMGPKPGPWIACADGLFVSVLPDWYHSDFSSIDTAVVPPREDRIGLVRGTVYQPLTNGRRNPLRDRVLVTVSSEFSDTLPNARNPVSPNRERLAPCMFFMADQLNPNLYRTLKRYGVDRLIASDFAALIVANNYPEGFAARWRPHPSLSIPQVQEYRRGIKSLGYLFSTYMDVTDYFPGNEFWDESKVALTPEGDFLDGWWGNYVIKPAAMADIVRTMGPKAEELYPSDCVYLDVHTNRGPQALDFEAGAPGAGLARQQVVANGDFIVEARKGYGATISEGLYRWMYAGLTDMDYATLITTGTVADLPPLVDFDLLKIHPFQHGTMMGHHPDRLLSKVDQAPLYQDSGRGLGPDGFYKYVAASLAYGHMVMLGYWYVPPPARFIHYYALMQGVQLEYLTDAARDIRYHNGTALVSTSQALAEGSQQRGRVCVRYSRGLGVFVNYNAATSWAVASGGRTYELPPYGWLIEKADTILAYSALIEGRRIDFVRCPEYFYLNTGGARVSEGPVEVAGAVWLKREDQSWRLLPCGDLGQWERFPAVGLPARFSDYRATGAPPERGCSYIALDVQALLSKPAAEARVTARNESDQSLPPKLRQLDARRLQFFVDEGIVDYVLE